MIVKRNPPETRTNRGSMKKKRTLPMMLPGKEFVSKIYGGNKPAQSGIYLAFYKYDPPLAHSNVRRHSGKVMASYKATDKSWHVCRSAGAQVANYSNGQWGINHKVLAFMGPLPVLNLESLEIYTPGYIKNQTFFIATLKEASNKLYTSGPLAEYLLAALKPGLKGDFIFVLDSDNPLPVPLAKWIGDDKHPNWKSLSEKAQNKYTKMMESLRK